MVIKPANLPLVLTCCFIVLLAFSLFNISFYLSSLGKNLWQTGKPQEVLSEASTIKLQEQIDQWENLLEKYPTYQRGYIELANLYIKGGRIKEAEKVLNVAESLDPNSPNLKNTLEELTNY